MAILCCVAQKAASAAQPVYQIFAVFLRGSLLLNFLSEEKLEYGWQN
jgi:hypothetical protein